MKKVLLITLFQTFLFYISHTQSPNRRTASKLTITGRVIDAKTQTALSHVSIEVYEPGQKTAIKNTITNDSGVFELAELLPIRYQLHISYIGFKDTILTTKLSSFHAAIDLGTISLTSLAKQLKEVQVTTQKQVIEQDADKLTYNVDADPESKNATAFEILHKVPMLSLDADDNLQLNGNSSYKILINGKSSTLFSLNQSEVFKNMQASAIKTIEVVTTPPSKYDASGIGGIINITTYKKNVAGYNGGINIKGTSPKGFSTNANTIVSSGKINMSANGAYNKNSNPVSKSFFSRFDKVRRNQLEQIGNSESNNSSINAGVEFNYEMNDLNVFSITYNTDKGKGTSNYVQSAMLYNDKKEITEAFRRLNISNNNNHSKSFSFDYQHSFKNNDARQLTFTYVRNRSNSNSNTDIILQPVINYKHSANTTANDEEIKEHTLQADYVQPIKKHTLEFGASTILRKNNSDYFYKVLDTLTHTFVLDTMQSNHFDYDEGIYAAYTSINLKLNKWNLKAGFRLEAAKQEAHFLSGIVTKDYLNLVPNITFSLQLKGISTVRMSYTQRIQRPDLYYLNPYIDITDQLNISFGNPALQPALGHIFNIAYYTFIKKTSINVSIFHQFTNNSIQQFTVLGADTVARTTYGNIGKNRNTNFAISSNTTAFKKLTININTMLNYIVYNSTIKEKQHTNNGLTYNVTGSFNLRLKNWRIGANAGYNAPNILVQGKTSSYISSSFSLNKFLLKNKNANLAFSISNPFKEYRRSFTELNDQALYQLSESLSVLRRYNFSISYRFNKVQTGNSGK